MTNPLLTNAELPLFNDIKPEHIVPALKQIISDNRQALENQLNAMSEVTWENLVLPLEERDDRLSKAWSPVSHLHGVKNSEALRNAYSEALTLLTEYSTELGQHQGLYEAYQKLRDSDEFEKLTQPQKKTIENTLRDFRLGGVALPEEERKRFKEIKQRLSELSTTFSNHVLDATQGWYFHTENEKDLVGIPETAIAGAKQAAESRELNGWVITLDIPAYLAVMTHGDNRELRQKMHHAYVTRASEKGLRLSDDGGEADPSEWDNTKLIDETLVLRHELAQLLAFSNYAERSLATKMAESTEQVLGFLKELAEKSKPQAEKEFSELQQFAKDTLELDELQPWDTAYVSEKLRQEKYAISQEELKPYFPENKVIDGMFSVVEKLFQVQFKLNKDIDTWHSDVQFFDVLKDGSKVASFYLDIYARENKRGGAWMADCVARRKTEAGMQLPVAFLTCNFTPPVGSDPSLLTHNEVTTLFHEFGHGLHHMLTDIDVAAVSGISGVEWDAVELPSQFLENWCWEPESIPMISAHFETGEPLPKELLDKMLAAKHFQGAMMMVRQLEFALFDFRLHVEYNAENPVAVQALLDEVREQVAVIKATDDNRFQNSFSHIFAGGYAAGYYSYKWAEVLSADAFSRFEDDGIFNEQTGADFLSCILSRGGSEPAMNLFKNFRGREPSIEPLLRHSGIQ